MKEILKFKDNNIEYVLLIDKGNLIYAKYEKGNILTNITKEEKDLIKKVFSSFLPSKNIIKLSNIKYNKKDINHVYDIEKDFHIFYEDKFNLTSDSLYLNYIFNNQNEYYSYQEKNKLEKEIRRIVKIGKKSLVVLVSFGILLTLNVNNLELINDVSLAEVSIQLFHEERPLDIKKNVTLDDIINAINNNPNLTDEEKEFFLSRPNYFIDNLENFYYDVVIDNLSNIYIEYIPSNCIYDSSIEGRFYHSGENKYKIEIYNATSFADANKGVLSHEFLHVFAKPGNINKLYEPVNAIMNSEYFGSSDDFMYDNSYSSIRKYIYMLSEIVGSDVLIKYQTNNSINGLVNKLIEIIPDERKAVDFLFKIEKLFVLKGKSFVEMDKLYNEINTIMKEYYEVKYQSSVEDNLNMYIWLDKKNTFRLIGSSLGYSGLELESIVDNGLIKRNKNIFNKSNNSNLILSIPNDFQEKEYYISIDEILDGYTNYNFKSEEEITLPRLDDGSYVGTYCYPISYFDYEIPIYQHETINNKR